MSAYLAPALAQLRTEVNTRWPGRDRTSDGWIGDAAHSSRVSDHNPDARGMVHAIDVDEDGIPPALLLRVAITDPRTRYVIYERLIYQRIYGFKPRTYTGINPHDKHMHISCQYDDALEQDRAPWFTDAVLTSHTTPVPGVDIPSVTGPAPARLTPEDDMSQQDVDDIKAQLAVLTGLLGGQVAGDLALVRQDTDQVEEYVADVGGRVDATKAWLGTVADEVRANGVRLDIALRTLEAALAAGPGGGVTVEQVRQIADDAVARATITITPNGA